MLRHSLAGSIGFTLRLGSEDALQHRPSRPFPRRQSPREQAACRTQPISMVGRLCGTLAGKTQLMARTVRRGKLPENLALSSG
jgi:hypothetical protein